MSKRLQVILDDEEMRDIQRLARQRQPRERAETKIQRVRAAARHSFPTGDIEQLLREIESGYLED